MSIEELFPGRAEILRALRSKAWCDVLVIGGGIHGACVAHLAAFNGLRTILLEQGDYAGETSGRSSKLAHGGLRYLELFDFRQVFEGIRAREDLFMVAPHLAEPHDFSVEIGRSETWQRLLLGAGLHLYDALSGFRRRHRWESLPEGGGRFLFTDGIMRDGQLVLERIIAARQEGAQCLNYMRVERVMAHKNDRMVAHCVDTTASENSSRFEIEAGVVMNCAGPFVGSFSVPQASSLQRQVVLSRGVHLLFDVPWQGAARVLPIRDNAGKRQRGRYFFVLPYRGLTMVGTTEKAMSAPVIDPLPLPEEIEELLSRIKNNVPHLGLNIERAYYAFAGIRTLCRAAGGAQRETTDTPQLSRKHRWVYSGGVLTLLGGKYTNAMLTAHDGLRTAFRLAGMKKEITSLKGRLLPGAANLGEERKLFLDAAQSAGVSVHAAERIVARLGARARYVREMPAGFERVGEEMLWGELMLAVHMEQAHTVSDIMRRRFELEFLPGHGLSHLESLCEALRTKWPAIDWYVQAQQYRERVSSVLSVLSQANPARG